MSLYYFPILLSYMDSLHDISMLFPYIIRWWPYIISIHDFLVQSRYMSFLCGSLIWFPYSIFLYYLPIHMIPRYHPPTCFPCCMVFLYEFSVCYPICCPYDSLIWCPCPISLYNIPNIWILCMIFLCYFPTWLDDNHVCNIISMYGFLLRSRDMSFLCSSLVWFLYSIFLHYFPIHMITLYNILIRFSSAIPSYEFFYTIFVFSVSVLFTYAHDSSISSSCIFSLYDFLVWIFCMISYLLSLLDSLIWFPCPISLYNFPIWILGVVFLCYFPT